MMKGQGKNSADLPTSGANKVYDFKTRYFGKKNIF